MARIALDAMGGDHAPQATVAGALLALGDIDPDARVGQLSISEQQIVEIAKALTLDCSILILDEPTAALTEREAAKQLDMAPDRVSKLCRSGVLRSTGHGACRRADILPKLRLDENDSGAGPINERNGRVGAGQGITPCPAL